ncbi:uncharacterized protein [Ambystoma mexicanum]|uniref:uncharacterized protein isoform X2 n=1 Tax=Ambystoma mexicanum TaxID=8296 RepID=UPI0037E7E04E
MEASLTCAVCLGLFEEPVTLPLCSHNFCRCCVQGCTSSPPGLSQQLCCPLCRKVSSVPGGATGLPVNTTLAEVVKLLRTVPCKDGDEIARGAGPCEKHSGRKLLLYCRMCHEGACGQCVSEEHQGPFHSINLMDITYQEEKLTFFSVLKKLRHVGEKLTKEISEDPNDIERVLQAQTEMITLKCDELTKALDLKRKQMMEYIENQRTKKVKEHQLWKQMKDVDKRTVGNLLEECEKIINECDPPSFLKVACGLNRRMNTKLELLHLSSGSAPRVTPNEINIQPVLDAISALQISTDDHFKDPFSEKTDSSGKFVFKRSTKRWKEEPERFCELHLKCYDSNRQVSDDVSTECVSERKKDSCIQTERKTLTLMKTRDAKKGRHILIRQACFDRSFESSSMVDVEKRPTSTSVLEISSNVGGRSQTAKALSAPLMEDAKKTQLVNETVFGEEQSKSTQSPAHFLAFPTLSSTSELNNALFNADKDTPSCAKEVQINLSVHPNIHDTCRPQDKSIHLLEPLSKLSFSSSYSFGTGSLTSANLVPRVTEPAGGKPHFSLAFGDSKSNYPSFDISKWRNPSSFSFTVAQSSNPTEVSAKVKTGSETKENTKDIAEVFSCLKLTAADAKSQHSERHKSRRSTRRTSALNEDGNKSSMPDNSKPLFSTNSFPVKPGFSFGRTSKNTTFPLSSSFLPLSTASESNEHEREKIPATSSSLPGSSNAVSLQEHASPVLGLTQNSLLPLSSNLSQNAPAPCASFMFSTMQSCHFAKEHSSALFHPLPTNTTLDTKDKIEENGMVSKNSKLCNTTKDSPQRPDTLISVSQFHHNTLPSKAFHSEPLDISTNKVSSVSLPLKEDSDIDESNQETSSSDCSCASEESVQQRTCKTPPLLANPTDRLPITCPQEENLLDDENSSGEKL